jgi:hypothetical protein
MKIRYLQNLLCVGLLSILAMQQTSQAEEPAIAPTPGQALFAYRSSLRARLHDSLFGGSVLPSDLPVELAPVDPDALEHATVNSTLTFRVVHEVTDGHVGYAYAGRLIDAKVIRVREGKLRIRRGTTEPRVLELATGGLIESSPACSFELPFYSPYDSVRST